MDPKNNELFCIYAHILCFSTYNGQYGSTKSFRRSFYLQSFYQCKLKQGGS